MKVYEKSVRKITVRNELFLWLVIEVPECIYLRVYSSHYKSSYFEVRFEWGSSHYINQNRPVIAKTLIEYALDNGWDSQSKSSVIKFDYGNQDIKHLNLEKY